jgi:hypothetical protein
MAAARVKVEQMQVIHDDHRMRVERVEEQAVKGLLQGERMGLGRGFNEILHVQEDPAGLFVHFLQDGRLAPTHAAREPQNGAELKARCQGVKRLLLCRGEVCVCIVWHKPHAYTLTHSNSLPR